MSEPLIVLQSNSVVAINPADGSVRWHTTLQDSNLMFARLAITEGVVLVAAYDSLACCDHKTGRLLWRVQTRQGGRSGVVAREGRVFLYKDGAVDCYDGRGQLLWRREAESHYGGSLGFSDDVCWVPRD